jgi:hypothetical protein
MTTIPPSCTVAWCDRCKAYVFTFTSEAERARLESEHDRSAHPREAPKQTVFPRTMVRA